MKTDKRMDKIKFNDNNIASIFKFCRSQKAHEVHNIRINKLRWYFIILSFRLKFDDFIADGLFSNAWKGVNVIPVHKT